MASILGELLSSQPDIGVDTLALKAKTTAEELEDYRDIRGQLVTHGVLKGESEKPLDRRESLPLKLFIRGAVVPARLPMSCLVCVLLAH